MYTPFKKLNFALSYSTLYLYVYKNQVEIYKNISNKQPPLRSNKRGGIYFYFFLSLNPLLHVGHLADTSSLSSTF